VLSKFINTGIPYGISDGIYEVEAGLVVVFFAYCTYVSVSVGASTGFDGISNGNISNLSVDAVLV
jgi:hypothetical protein